MILRGEPLSLEALAGNLDYHEVKIVDLKAAPDTFIEILTDFHPGIVGITGVTCEANNMLRLASMAKATVKATVVVGGIHASNDPYFFNRSDIDYIVLGLGKLSFGELLTALESGERSDTIPGIIKTNPRGQLTFTQRRYSSDDLVEEKPPRYDLVNQYREHYILQKFGFRIGFVSSAFGCPHRCSFCCIEHIAGGHYLTHEPKTVIRDIGLLGDIPLIRLVDANSFGNIAHARALCESIQKAGIQKGFVVDVRSDAVVRHADLFVEWKKAGLRSVIVGFEEIDDGKLHEMEKVNTVAINSEAIRILHDIGITVVGDFIISPDYDESQFEAMSVYIEENHIDLPMFSILTPLPGTSLYELMKERIINHNLDFYTLTNAVIPTRMAEKAFYENYANLMKSGHAGTKL